MRESVSCVQGLSITRARLLQLHEMVFTHLWSCDHYTAWALAVEATDDDLSWRGSSWIPGHQGSRWLPVAVCFSAGIILTPDNSRSQSCVSMGLFFLR